MEVSEDFLFYLLFQKRFYVNDLNRVVQHGFYKVYFQHSVPVHRIMTYTFC